MSKYSGTLMVDILIEDEITEAQLDTVKKDVIKAIDCCKNVCKAELVDEDIEEIKDDEPDDGQV